MKSSSDQYLKRGAILLVGVASTALLLATSSAYAAEGKAVAPPNISGIEVKVGETIVIQPDAWYPVVSQFADGRISVGWQGSAPTAGRWSKDGGRSWQDGVGAPSQVTVEVGNGEVVSLGYDTKKRPDGKFNLDQRRSLDGWKTFTSEVAIVDVPHAVPCGGDGAEKNDGFLMDHGILQLKDGRLMASMYGNYDSDKTPADDYPVSSHFNKYRTIVVFSSDKGKTWGDPVTVATGTKQTQEGPCEADLVRTRSGDILCAMRTGGKPGQSTPSIVARSNDEGRTWSAPVPMLDRGVWPNLCVMDSGLVIAATGRAGNWLTFSKDDGHSWGGAFNFYEDQYPATSSYNTVLQVGPDTALVIYDRQISVNNQPAHRQIVGTFLTVAKK